MVFGGALFAAFPEAYATIFSGFYLALMLLLFALIFRAVSIEFRSKMPFARPGGARGTSASSPSSLLASFLFGVAVGDAMLGIPLDGARRFHRRASRPAASLRIGRRPGGGGDVRHARRDLPLPEIARRRGAGTCARLDVAYLGNLPGAVYAGHDLHGGARCLALLANFERFPWAPAVVVVSVLAIANIPRSRVSRKAGAGVRLLDASRSRPWSRCWGSRCIPIW